MSPSHTPMLVSSRPVGGWTCSPARLGHTDGGGVAVVLPGAERVHDGFLGLRRGPEAGGGGGVAVAERHDGARPGI